MPKSGSSEPEGQPAQRKNQPAQRQLRSGVCRKAEVVSPKANPPSDNLRNGRRKNQPAEGNPEAVQAISESKRPTRAAKTTQGERSPSTGRSRETRGRRSSADTPTNTIEKRDCDTLRPSEVS